MKKKDMLIPFGTKNDIKEYVDQYTSLYEKAIEKLAPFQDIIAYPPSLESCIDVCSLSQTRRFLSYVNFELSTKCNLSCVGCFRSNENYPGKNQLMSLSSFKKNLNNILCDYSIGSCLLEGVGESTLHPELLSIVKYAKSKANKIQCVSLISNVLTRTLSYYDALFLNGLDQLYISIDSLIQKEADKLRKGTDVKLLIKRLKYLCNNYPKKIQIISVVSNQNFKTIFDTVDLLIKGGIYKNIKQHQFQPYQEFGSHFLELSKSETSHFLKKVQKYNKENNIPLMVTNSFFDLKLQCIAPFTSSYITVDGYVTPCCVIVTKEKMNYGRLDSKPFSNMFQSEQAVSIRKKIKNNKYPDICKNCPQNSNSKTPYKL